MDGAANHALVRVTIANESNNKTEVLSGPAASSDERVIEIRTEWDRDQGEH